MIITGAPVENLEFNQVDYWPELCEIMAWSRTHVHSTLHICWGAQAGLYFHHGIEKRSLPRKLFGVYEHRVLKPSSPLFRGFDDVFCAPHSRYTEVWEKDIRAAPGLELLATSSEAGVYAVKTEDSSQFFIMVEQAPHLDASMPPWQGYRGYGVADAIVSTKRDWNDKPRQPQRMKKVTVETFGVDYPEPEKSNLKRNLLLPLGEEKFPPHSPVTAAKLQSEVRRETLQFPSPPKPNRSPAPAGSIWRGEARERREE